MSIDNKQVIKFSNEQIRPMAQKMRNLYYEMKSMEEDWNSDLSSLVKNDVSEIIEDGRDLEGINKLSGEDLHSLMTLIAGYIKVMETDRALDETHKPCVTKLEVS